jgi:hypothetical protein
VEIFSCRKEKKKKENQTLISAKSSCAELSADVEAEKMDINGYLIG